MKTYSGSPTMFFVVILLLLSSCSPTNEAPSATVPPTSVPIFTGTPAPAPTQGPTATQISTANPETEIVDEYPCDDGINNPLVETTMTCYILNEGELFVRGTVWYLGNEMVAIEVAYSEDATDELIAEASEYITKRMQAAGWNMDDVTAASQAISLESDYHTIGSVIAGMRQAMGIRISFILVSYVTAHTAPSPTP